MEGVRTVVCALCVGVGLFCVRAVAAGEVPITGAPVPALKTFDEVMVEFMSARKIPGGSLAVVKDGRVVYARGFGYGDREKREAVEPSSEFRIASCSKMITGVAILKLMEEPKNHLTMETAAFEYLDAKPLSASDKIDPRLKKITIRHLLHHTGGWDRDKSGDPMFDHSIDFAELAHKLPPTDAETMVRGMMGKPLDHEPGERKVYSNFGYCVLGRIIEKASGMTYENYVKEKVLAPMGITDMYIGRTQEANRGKQEVRYYQDDDGDSLSIFPSGPRKVKNPYGAWCLETMDAHGGWVATATDMARFITTVDRFLKPESMALFVERATTVTKERLPGAYYACGVMARPFTDGGKRTYNLWHDGSLPGTNSLVVRRHDGVTWAVVFNQRHVEGSKLPDAAIDKELHRAADSVTQWPIGDLYGVVKHGGTEGTEKRD